MRKVPNVVILQVPVTLRKRVPVESPRKKVPAVLPLFTMPHTCQQSKLGNIGAGAQVKVIRLNHRICSLLLLTGRRASTSKQSPKRAIEELYQRRGVAATADFLEVRLENKIEDKI